MTKQAVNIRNRRKLRNGPGIDHNRYLNSLLASIYDSSVENPLNLGQIKVVMDHLKYALVAGYESAYPKPRL